MSLTKVQYTSASAIAAFRKPILSFADGVSIHNTFSSRCNRLSDKRRLINRGRKSAVATLAKKVFKAVKVLSASEHIDDSNISPIEQLISEAYSEIDKAVRKGVIHRNTGNRRKSRIAGAKRKLLIAKGLYT